MNVVRQGDLNGSPWKNGGGVTRHIATAWSDEAVLWRLSLADVAQDGAFSRFPRLLRVLTVVSGAGMQLAHDQGTMVANPHDPVAFDGAVDLVAHLVDGPLRAFNVMYDPVCCTAQVDVLRGPASFKIATPDGAVAGHTQTVAVYSIAGRIDLGAISLDAGDTALAGDAACCLSMAAGDVVLVVRFGNGPQTSSARRRITLA